jgi:hypothetical protein
LGLLAPDAALRRLAGHGPLKARLVELRYFAGMTGGRAAAAAAPAVPGVPGNPGAGRGFSRMKVWRGGPPPGWVMNEEEVFRQALARGSPQERAAYLDRACAGD